MPTTRHFAAVAAWIAVVAAILLAGNDREVRGIAPPPAPLLALRAIDPAAVSGLRITRSGDELQLVRGTDGWTAPGHFGVAGRGPRIEAAIRSLIGIEDAQQRGASPSSHATFEVTAEDFSLTLEGTAPGLPTTVRVGSADTFERSYLRFGDDAAVYSVRPNLRYELELGNRLEVDDWLDLLLTDLSDDAEIIAASFRTEAGTIALKRLQAEVTDAQGAVVTAAVWQVTEPEAFLADTVIVDGFLRNVRKVNALAVADPALLPESGIVDPVRTVEFRLASGETIAIDVGNEVTTRDGQSGLFARRRGEETLYILPAWSRTNLFKTLDQLRRGEGE